jgi:hypothetical protein
MFKLIATILGLGLTLGIGGSVYDSIQKVATSAHHAYKFDQISYAKFTKAMTEEKPRRPTKN